MSTMCYANDWRDINTKVEQSGCDDAIHVGVGIATSAIVYKLTDSKALAFITPILIGTIKELTDKNFDAKDIAGYGVGSVVTQIVIRF